MVNYVDIENTLIHLDTSYLSSMSDPLLPILLSKTALIEFSGWIEQSMDQILYEYLDSHICETRIVQYIKGLINKNYGFKYEDNILKILSSALPIAICVDSVQCFGEKTLNLHMRIISKASVILWLCHRIISS